MVILINGSINAGKSTVAKLVASALPNTALLEIDMLREMVEWMPLQESIPLNLENAVSLIRNFEARGINVVVPYPLSRVNYDYILSALSENGIEVRAFTLAPALETALNDRGTRALTDAERERIRYHYDIGIHAPDFGEVIDNSAQSPEETAEQILKTLR